MFEQTKLSLWSRYVFVELADVRVNNLPLIRSPLPLFGILACYVIFVLKVGPNLMKNRKPFKLQKLLVLYNALQVLISIALVYPGIYYCYIFGTYSWKCEGVDRSRSPLALKIAYGFYFYFLAKLSELLDTVFFVLRKKDNQVSFLHVYHHSGMPLIAWFLTKYFPGGQFIFSGTLNSMVHTVMYTYYMISAMGPQYQKYLWWKKYITTMQLVQFFIATLHMLQLLWTDCGIPGWIAIFTLPNGIMFYKMFNDFYKQTYKKQQMLTEKRKMIKNGIAMHEYEKPKTQ